MFPPVYQTLKNAAAVASIVGDRIYRRGRAPLRVVGATQPPQAYVVWQLVAGAPENNLTTTPTVDRQTVQVDCYSMADNECTALAVAVRDAIEPHAHMTGTVIDEQEPETRLYRIGMQFDWFVHRAA